MMTPRTAFEDEFIDQWVTELLMVPVAERAECALILAAEIKQFVRRHFPELSKKKAADVAALWMRTVTIRTLQLWDAGTDGNAEHG